MSCMDTCMAKSRGFSDFAEVFSLFQTCSLVNIQHLSDQAHFHRSESEGHFSFSIMLFENKYKF